VVAESDVVITTAVIPGKKPPILVTEDMVKSMAPGSVIVDLASERGGNCELTEASKIVVKHNVNIVGYINLASSVPYHASQMYARNVCTFLTHLFKGGKPELNLEDEITRETLITRGGEIVQAACGNFRLAGAEYDEKRIIEIWKLRAAGRSCRRGPHRQTLS